MGGRRLARPQVLRRLLLDLFSPHPLAPGALAGLDEDDWRQIAAMADQHRLGPMLHARRDGEQAIPATVREGWRAAHRYWTMAAMLVRAELPRVAGLLENAGHAPIALKGAWLSAHAYPDPALRPVRDIDLLVPHDSVIPAFETLLGAGYTLLQPPELPLEEIVRIDKHMPPLRSPGGVVIELHHRLWEAEGQRDHRVPCGAEEGVRSRAIMAGGIRFPCPEDMCAHLIVHAVYSHRLDCGPLLLSDIAAIARAHPIDWNALRARARIEGWSEGAALVLSLVGRYDPALASLCGTAGPEDVPESVLDLVPDLLLQDLETRRSAGLFATLHQGRPGAFVRRLRARRAGGEPQSSVSRDLAGEGGLLRWMLHRTRRSLAEIGSGEVRRQSRNLATVSKWLNSEN